ncbi:MAG: glycosyltransferase family 2 protein [Peptococcaceae bacterium]|nr:glycosyltransferase family 2 protein [Peptococcaceae bacterium]
MNKNPKISIIIPVYNVENYLGRCLESVLNQTLMDIEIICVNDGTKDNSVSIIEDYMKIDNRICLVNKENGGLSSARNAGIKQATGEYLIFLDSDDYLSVNACERVYIERLENNADIIVFGSHIFPTIPYPNDWLRKVLSPKTKFYKQFEPDALFKHQGATPFVWRNCIKRSFLEKTDILFDESIRFGEDLIFQLCLFPQAGSIAFIADKLYNYRWYREGSLMETVGRDFEQKFKLHIGMVRIITDYWQEKGFLKLYGAEYLSWITRFLLVDLCEAKFSNKKQYAREIYKILENADVLVCKNKLELKEKYVFLIFLKLANG